MTNGIKRIHHFVHDGYLKQWKKNDAIYVYDRKDKNYFIKKGKDLAAERDLNYISFDRDVISLIKYANTVHKNGNGNKIGEMISCFLEALISCNYPHKENNAIEDFFSKFETDFEVAISAALNQIPLIDHKSQKSFNDLIFFFFIQLLRTPKSRKALSKEMPSIYLNESKLSQSQKEEYIAIQLLIIMLSLAMDVIAAGCKIELIRTKKEETLINCDAPALLDTINIKSINEIQGRIPLSPNMIMKISEVGCGFKIEKHAEIREIETRKINKLLFSNANRFVYFSSQMERTKIVNSMTM